MKRQERIAAIICMLVGIACILWAQCVDAREFKLIELRETTIAYRSFLPGGSDASITDNGLSNKTLGEEVNLHVNVDFARYFYLNNRVHGTTDKDATTGEGGQFRMIGWNYSLGVRLSSYLNVEYEHHSQHALDHTLPRHFPLEDSIGFKLFIYKAHGDSHTILP